MAGLEVETLVLLSKVGSKEGLVQICENAYIGRNKKTYPMEVIKRTGLAAGLENTQQIDKYLHSVAHLALHSLTSGWVRPEQAILALQAPQDVAPTLALVLPLWRSLALKHMVGPPRLVDFSAQVCSKTGVSGNAGTQASCLLNLTLEEDWSREQVSVELSKPMMATLVADLGRVRDQLSAIAGHK